jgi:glycyl-tRNA synthetase (class II)
MAEFEKSGEITIPLKGGKEVKLTKEHIAFETYEKTLHEEKYVPSVIEPSFGK